jgi:hypothetical protein
MTLYEMLVGFQEVGFLYFVFFYIFGCVNIKIQIKLKSKPHQTLKTE